MRSSTSTARSATGNYAAAVSNRSEESSQRNTTVENAVRTCSFMVRKCVLLRLLLSSLMEQVGSLSCLKPVQKTIKEVVEAGKVYFETVERGTS